MAVIENNESEYITGDQPFGYRKRRGFKRYPRWDRVINWRKRWDVDKVRRILEMLGKNISAEEIGNETGFGIITKEDAQGREIIVPDLRGFDVTLISPEERNQLIKNNRKNKTLLDFSYYCFEGARLTDLDLSNAQLTRTCFQKATLRRVNFTHSILTKANLEDADLRDAILDNASIAHIRYTEDKFWWRGTIFRGTHLNKALYVDPLLERCARDQDYLYVLKYRNQNNHFLRIFFSLWWITSNYGKSFLLWAMWSFIISMTFAFLYYILGTDAFVHENLEWNFQTSFYYSVVTFTTLGFGDVTPKTSCAIWYVISEVTLGYLMLGGLISIFATKMARRG